MERRTENPARDGRAYKYSDGTSNGLTSGPPPASTCVMFFFSLIPLRLVVLFPPSHTVIYYFYSLLACDYDVYLYNIYYDGSGDDDVGRTLVDVKYKRVNNIICFCMFLIYLREKGVHDVIYNL